MAHYLADHALLLLAAAMVSLLAGTSLVAAVARLAARHRDRLWWAIDLIVPGHLWQPRVYLAVHLALGLVLVASLAGFIVIAENVAAGREIARFDVAFAEALRSRISPAWRSLFWYLTWLGSGPVIAAVAGAVIWLLARRRETLLLITWSVSQGGSALINYALKAAFARARPEGADPVLYGGGWSFPSGHAMNTLVLCGVGAYLVIRLSESRGRLWITIAFLLAWALAIGFSRLYLGVHYVSDVVAGFFAGVAWIAVCVSGTEVAYRGRRRSGTGAHP
jgi:undecaprenyl-diphosphatase